MSRVNGKPGKTLTDHLVSMICPLLIMAMTGSLVLFLIEIGYEENAKNVDRLRWVMFWFVVATVLIARISILQGTAYAGLYSLALGSVTLMYLHRFVGLVPLIVILIVLIWLCTHKLTWDCTFLDDDGANENSMLGEEAESDTGDLGNKAEEDDSKGKRKNRRPGLWVIWFSLGALPTFGIGQALGGSDDAALKDFGFKLLAIYLAAGLGLLVATSFLNVRQYLRKHYLRMPARVSRIWLMAGGLLSLFLLVGVLLLPRPNAKYSMNSLIDQTSEMVQEASEHAFMDWGGVEDEKVEDKVASDDEQGSGDAKDDSKGSDSEDGMKKEGDEGSDSGGDGKEGEGESGEGNQGKGSQGKGDGSTAESVGEGESEGEGESGEKGEPQGSEGEESGPTPSPSEMPSSDWISTVVKVVLWTLIIGGILFFAIKNRVQLMKAIRSLIDDLLALFGQKKAKIQPVPIPVKKSIYADFQNPFLSGMSDRCEPEELIGYTYQAMKAFANDRLVITGEGKTPREFAEEIGDKAPEMRNEVSETAELYSRLAFTQYGLPDGYLLSLKKLWAKIS
ncbi:DUF4129 domain-containing protein [Verrucomicrobia bacterium]|nr:DUF4129 domain-containing protein [Verrucomicrobiota bacterium]